jgi:integrase
MMRSRRKGPLLQTKIGCGRERHLVNGSSDCLRLGAVEQAGRNKSIRGRDHRGAGRAEQLREREFSETEWRTILDASLAPPPPRMARHNAMARRWVPWLCAYTGSRPGEITQLRGQDVQHHHGLWVIRSTPEAGAVKGRRARTVPLRDDLLEQGFIQFAQAQGDGPLFYDTRDRGGDVPDPLKPVRAPWVKSREKLAEWVRSLGVNDPNISPNHAWRHTFKRRASRAGIERHVRDAICGHKLRDVGDKYEAPTVEGMAVALRKLPRYALSPSESAAPSLPHEHHERLWVQLVAA